MDGHDSYLTDIARRLLDEGPDQPMVDAMKDLAGESAERCPKELTILAHSVHPEVTVGGNQVWDQPPEVPRLTEQELDELHKRIAGPDNPRGPRGEVRSL